MKRLAILLALCSCTAAQKKTAVATSECTVQDAAQIIAILDGSGSGAAKLLQLSTTVEPEIAACVLAATRPSVGSGSAK